MISQGNFEAPYLAYGTVATSVASDHPTSKVVFPTVILAWTTGEATDEKKPVESVLTDDGVDKEDTSDPVGDAAG